jgi:hypothetical protein
LPGAFVVDWRHVYFELTGRKLTAWAGCVA